MLLSSRFFSRCLLSGLGKGFFSRKHESTANLVPHSQSLPTYDHRQEQQPLRPKGVDPSLTSVILFPGEGAHFVGMGEELLDAPNVQGMFESARRILGYNLLDLCLDGPEEELSKTEHSQAAVYTVSLAAIEKLRVTHPGVVEACVATAGYGEGEIASLSFAGAFSFEDGLRLVKLRAEAMQYASQLVPGGLMTIMFGSDAKVNFACLAAREWCQSKGIDQEKAVCSIAGYLFPHCKIIGGHQEALKFLEFNGHQFGIRKTIRLPVSGAFHTDLMLPARIKLRNILQNIPFNELHLPVHNNLDCKVYRYEKQVRETLPRQLVKPVKWEQILSIIYRRPEETNMPKTFICGPGDALMLLLKNVNMRAYEHAMAVSV